MENRFITMKILSLINILLKRRMEDIFCSFISVFFVGHLDVQHFSFYTHVLLLMLSLGSIHSIIYKFVYRLCIISFFGIWKNKNLLRLLKIILIVAFKIYHLLATWLPNQKRKNRSHLFCKPAFHKLLCSILFVRVAVNGTARIMTH